MYITPRAVPNPAVQGAGEETEPTSTRSGLRFGRGRWGVLARVGSRPPVRQGARTQQHRLTATPARNSPGSQVAVGSMLFVALLHLATPLEPPQVPRLNLYPPRRVALLVEPTPFTHISGYSNRFKEMLRFLVAAGDEVHRLVVRCRPTTPNRLHLAWNR